MQNISESMAKSIKLFIWLETKEHFVCLIFVNKYISIVFSRKGVLCILRYDSVRLLSFLKRRVVTGKALQQ